MCAMDLVRVRSNIGEGEQFTGLCPATATVFCDHRTKASPSTSNSKDTDSPSLPMRTNLLSLLPLVAIVSLAACQSPEAESAQAEMAVSAPASYPGWDSFGESFTVRPHVDNTVSFADVAANATAFDGQTFRMTATIEEVCQTKGCWMTFTEGDASMRVKFKDYAFFMPFDSSGKTAVVEGEFSYTLVPAEEEAHYLEDAGKMEEAAAMTEDVMRMTFMASSVLIAQ